MAPSSTPDADAARGASLARAALHPGPLALLVAGGAAGAAIASWPLAAAGAVAYAAGVAVLAAVRGGGGGPRAGAPLVAPDPRPITIRATEIMALVVRIRKGHAAMHRALCETTDNVRAFCRPGYERLCELVEHAWGLARKADELKAHLDRSTPAVEIERARLEKKLAEAIAGLTELGAALEGWQAKVLRMNAESADRAEADSREVMDELERMDHLVRALEETK